jgi:hypothetical protein
MLLALAKLAFNNVIINKVSIIVVVIKVNQKLSISNNKIQIVIMENSFKFFTFIWLLGVSLIFFFLNNVSNL